MLISLRLNIIQWALLCMFLISFACSPNDDSTLQQIVLVFENSANSPSFRDRGTKIKYIDDNMIRHVVNLDKNTTHHIHLSREYIDVAWQDKKKTTQHFLFENGDSIHFRMEDNWLVAQIKNRDVDDGEVNFERKKSNDLYHGKPSALEDFYYYWNLANAEFSTVSGKSIANDLNNLKKRAYRELVRENSYIDSLKRIGKLSEDIAEFHHLKNDFTNRKLKLYQLTAIDFGDTKRAGDLFEFGNYMPGPLGENMALYTFYDDMLSRLYEQWRIDSSDINVDYIMGIPWLPKEAKQSLAFRQVDNLLNSYTIDEGIFLLEHLNLKDTITKGWKAYFNKKYFLDKQINGSWKLRDQVGQTLTFDELLRYYRGELLYIDFWASWCVPCIKAMPESGKLSLEYSGKPVRFIYLSIDQSEERWKRAREKYLDFAVNGSFYIDSLNHEKVRKAFQLTSIPRYMLFDRNGKLLDQNAPDPKSDEIKKLFDRYLRDNKEKRP